MRPARFPRLREKALCAFALALVSLPGSESTAAEAIRIEVEFFEDGREEPVNRATVWTSDRRVRIEQRAAGEAAPPPVFIYRGDQDLLLSVSERERSFVKLERRMLSLLGGGTSGARPEVDAQLGGLPQDQQRAFGYLLGASALDPKRPDDPLVVTREQERSSVAVHPCTRVNLSRSGSLLAQGCVADWDTVGLTPDDVEVFRSLAHLAHDAMGSRLPIPIETVPGQPLDLVVQFGGFPLAFERAGNAREASAIRVASVERVPAEDSLFEAPAGFTPRAGMSGLAGLASLLKPSSTGGRASLGATAPGSAAAVPAALDPAADPDELSASDAASKSAPGVDDSTNATRADRRLGAVRRMPKPYPSISLFEDPE